MTKAQGKNKIWDESYILAVGTLRYRLLGGNSINLINITVYILIRYLKDIFLFSLPNMGITRLCKNF
jgi:hypothetical protein